METYGSYCDLLSNVELLRLLRTFHVKWVLVRCGVKITQGVQLKQFLHGAAGKTHERAQTREWFLLNRIWSNEVLIRNYKNMSAPDVI